ncbi:MAG: shikimate dehydrogenase [Anaerolineae bacterium]
MNGHFIDGTTRLVGLIGWPVRHSRSPVVHNAAFAALGLNWRYVPLPTPPARVGEAVRGLVALGFRGANVTVPHKETVLPYLDALAPAAAALGAVNTLVIDRSGDASADIRGHNTDVPGFLAALRSGDFEPQGKRAIVIGAGGAARAVVYALLSAGAQKVTVLNRTPSRAVALVDDLAPHAQATALHGAPLTAERLVEAAYGAHLLVNATTVGMWPHTHASIWPDEASIPAHLTVMDLVYRPRETRLLAQARAAGAHPIDGLGMLIHQGALAFDLWTAHAHDLEEIGAIMESALLKRRAAL